MFQLFLSPNVTLQHLTELGCDQVQTSSSIEQHSQCLYLTVHTLSQLQLKKSVNKLQVNNRSVLREAYETY
jgi:hypothetical protein